MTRRPVTVFVGLGLIAAMPLFAEEGFPRSFEVISTERLNFAPGGTIRLNNSYGYLSIDGWDEPQVEITVIKSTDRFYDPSQQQEAKRRFELVHVAAERVSDTELSITTTLPSRHGFRVPPMKRTKKDGITVEYRIHVPHNSRLAIHHDTGYVWVSDVTGEIEASSHTGDMIVLLPNPGQYSIDARTRMGSVTSDFTGHGNKQFLLGTKFASTSEGAPRRVYLRIGRGSITVKQDPPPLTASNN